MTVQKMNPEIKRRWLDALPKYEQGTGHLNQNGRFCCLGVLCDVVKEDLGAKWVLFDGNTYYVAEGGGSAKTLPPAVQSFVGISGGCGTFDNILGASLAHLNDTGHTFEEIAKVIEKYF